MKNLYELTQIVNRIKTRRIEIIGKEKTIFGKQTKKLYDGIVSGKYKTEREAAIDIYGPKFKANNFSRLKVLLTEKLINTIFFIDLADYKYNDFQKLTIECEKLRAAVKLLLSRNARNSAIEIAEKIIRKSMKNEMTEITLEIGRILKRHFRVHHLNKEKAALYDEIVQYYFKILTAEIEVENCYELIIRASTNTKNSREVIVENVNNYEDKIHEIFPKITSYKLGLYAYMASIKKYEYLRDLPKTKNACEMAIQYFESKATQYPTLALQMFYSRFLALCIPMKKFDEGNQIAEKLLPQLDSGSINWYIVQDNYFLLSLHTQNYIKAEAIHQEVINHKRFRVLGDDYKEKWKVYEAYLAYLRNIGSLEKNSGKSFKLGKFLNEVPIFSKDKKGINIAIIIIQILHLIAMDKEVKVIDKVESLRMYVHNHLRNDDSLRSNCFIKMLLKMVQSKFHKNGTIRRTKSLHDKMVNTPILEKSLSQYIEIIPYEELWKLSLGQLSNRAY